MKNLVPSNDQHLLLSNCSPLGHTFSIFFVEQLSVKPNENSYLIASAYIFSLWATWSLTVFWIPNPCQQCISSVESVAVGLLHHLIKINHYNTNIYSVLLQTIAFLWFLAKYSNVKHCITPIIHIVQTRIQNCYKGMGWGWGENLRKKPPNLLILVVNVYTHKN